VRFFLDNNLPPQFCAVLGSLDTDNKFVHLRERFAPSAPDQEWLPVLASEGDWIVVSGDVRISKSEKLREAWKEAAPKLTTFFLAPGWTNHTIWEQAWRIVRWWPLILEQANRVAAGARFMVPVATYGKFQTLR
jgi:hypothetical protein